MKITATSSTNRIDIPENVTREHAARSLSQQIAGQIEDIVRANANISVDGGKRTYSISVEVKLIK